MSTKLTKDEVKKPDHFLEYAQAGFNWIQKKSKLVFGAVGFAVVVGAAIAGSSYLKQRSEVKAQSEYYQFERLYSDKKRELSKANAKADFDKDFAETAAKLEKFIAEHGKTKAAAMASLLLVEIYQDSEKADQALKVSESAFNSYDSNDAIKGLLGLTVGNLFAQKNDCASALRIWEPLAGNKKFEFINDDLKVRMGVCYEQVKDFSKAESMYTEVSQKKEKDSDFTAAKDAERYLRLLKIKKTQGS